MDETSGSTPISTRLERIATLARQLRDQPLTTLAHYIDLDWLREAHRRTRKAGAPGVDGQTADEYAKQLEANLRSLLERAKSGTYRAPPARRAYIPKGKGEMRPLGIPTFEDQGAAAGGRDASGGGLRAGVFGLLVRLPAQTLGAAGAGRAASRGEQDGRRMDHRDRYPEVLRLD